MKHISITSAMLVIMLLTAIGCTPNPSVFSTPVPTPTTVAPAAKTPVPGVITESIGEVNGRIVPKQFARVAFSTNGMVAKVNVTEGAQVKAGDVLAELDSKDLALQVQAAKDQLQIAQASLAQLKAPATQEDIATAQAVYDSTFVALQAAQRAATKEDLIILKSNLEKAQAQLDQAQAVYDRIGGANNPYIGMMPQSLQLQQATADYQIAEANYYKALSPNPANIAQLVGSLAQADANLRQKKFGPKPEEIAVAQARVQQAQTALDQANAGLAKAKLIAPISGTINGLAMNVGELMQAGSPVALIVDVSELRVETTELDEFGVTAISKGQSVRVTIDALPDKVLNGTVLYIISPALPLDPNQTTYTATIALETQDSALRYGMNVKVEFIAPH